MTPKGQLSLLTAAGQPRRTQRGQWRRRGSLRPGRRPKGLRAGSPHKRRPRLLPHQPVHVVLRVVRAAQSLRRRTIFQAVRWATIAVARRELHWAEHGAFRIVHISIQRTHVHLIVEASHRMALSRGMQSFQISAAKHINRAISPRCGPRRRGAVFPDRFHQEILTTPRRTRHALAYVLNNWRKHREDTAPSAPGWRVDPFSTGLLFDGWREMADQPLISRPRTSDHPLVVYRPRTWLLRIGWRRSGLVGFRERPRGA